MQSHCVPASDSNTAMVITGFTRWTSRLSLIGALSVAAGLALAACGGGSAPTAAPSAVASVVTVTQTLTPTPVTPTDAGDPSATQATDPGLDPSLEPTGPPVIRNVTTPKKLTLADIFEAEAWEEGVYQIPRSTTGQQAIGTVLSGCYSRSMEVRLAEPTGKASVTVAQALDSAESDVILQFKLLANGRLVDTKTVRFNQSATLTAALNGVSALTLEVEKAPASKVCGATAVVTDFSITPT